MSYGDVIPRREIPPGLRGRDGQLDSFAWPGGYPILYLDSHNCVLCPDCAHQEELDCMACYAKQYGEPDWFDMRDLPVAYFIHYEGPPEICESCNKVIESAYGDPDAEEAPGPAGETRREEETL
jgi:hypothetical protein